MVLYSPRTAKLFVELARAAGVAERCRGLIAYCLSRAVADAAKALPWRDVVVARRPNQDSLVDAIRPAGDPTAA